MAIPRGAINHNKGTDRKRDGQTLTRIRGSKRGLPAIWNTHGHMCGHLQMQSFTSLAGGFLVRGVLVAGISGLLDYCDYIYFEKFNL